MKKSQHNPSGHRQPKSPRPRKTTMAKLIRAGKNKLFKQPSTPRGR